MLDRFALVGTCSATMRRHSPERVPQPVAQLTKTATCRDGAIYSHRSYGSDVGDSPTAVLVAPVWPALALGPSRGRRCAPFFSFAVPTIGCALVCHTCQVFRGGEELATQRHKLLCVSNLQIGGEGGIRTHVPLTRQDAFEAPPLRPLRYLSAVCYRTYGDFCRPPNTAL